MYSRTSAQASYRHVLALLAEVVGGLVLSALNVPLLWIVIAIATSFAAYSLWTWQDDDRVTRVLPKMSRRSFRVTLYTSFLLIALGSVTTGLVLKPTDETEPAWLVFQGAVPITVDSSEDRTEFEIVWQVRNVGGNPADRIETCTAAAPIDRPDLFKEVKRGTDANPLPAGSPLTLDTTLAATGTITATNERIVFAEWVLRTTVYYEDAESRASGEATIWNIVRLDETQAFHASIQQRDSIPTEILNITCQRSEMS